MEVLKVNNLNKSFGDNHILKDISFTMNESEILCFLGRNGSGKSTTMKWKTRSEVAKECEISMRSLATSLSRIYSKLDVRNYQGLVDKALELGYKKIIF